MSRKRHYDLNPDDDDILQDIQVSNKKHSLDSDEEDSDEYEQKDLCESDIEGEEDGVSKTQDEVKITPFNMREELEEGHFDNEGHYHWNKSNEIRDNWLDNIDWVKVEDEKRNKESDGLSDGEGLTVYNEISLYRQVLAYMAAGETIAGTLRRLGKNRAKMTSVERLKLKKQGVPDENGEKITKLTELANEILTKTGDMDVYQATYESIQEKINSSPSTSKECSKPSFDMYSDDFNEKEKEHRGKNVGKLLKVDSKQTELLWEFKWKENDVNLQGPYNTKQMHKWSKSGYFKNGVYVRKVGDLTNFYSSSRIDFDLYI